MANQKPHDGKSDVSGKAQQGSEFATEQGVDHSPAQHTRHEQHQQQQAEGGRTTQGLGKQPKHEAEKKQPHGNNENSSFGKKYNACSQ